MPTEYWVDDYWECCWFHLMGDAASTRFASASIFIDRTDMGKRVQGEMDSLISEYIGREAGWETICRMHAELLTAYFRRELALDGYGLDRRVDADLMALRDAVNGNLGYSWTLDALASAMHCSQSTLERLVHRCYGMSPMRMVTTLRVDRIKTLLSTTGYTCDVIADMVGYTNGFSMSKAFAKSVGVCPREYRRRQRAKLEHYASSETFHGAKPDTTCQRFRTFRELSIYGFRAASRTFFEQSRPARRNAEPSLPLRRRPSVYGARLADQREISHGPPQPRSTTSMAASQLPSQESAPGVTLMTA